jgi:putative ABC transport system ATP-binding protein
MSALSLTQLGKTYRGGAGDFVALRDVSFDITQGEFVAVTGPSGSGKTTLMNILGCLDQPSAGEYRIDGAPVSGFGAGQLARLRNEKLGFVFQNFNLLPRLTVLENVELPLVYAGMRRRERHVRARELIDRVGLEGREKRLPSQLSGGQQQRVAIARALANRPGLLLADEPTGNLDSETSHAIMALIEQINRDAGMTVVLVTHEADIAAFASRNLHFKDGRLVSDSGREL